jgi:hypothetical protein
MKTLPVASSQTWKKGDLLKTDTNGRLVLAAAASNNIAAVDASGFGKLYIAGNDQTTPTQDTLVPVECGDDATRLRLPLTTNGSAQAFAQSQVDKAYEIRNVGGIFAVDVNANTNAKVNVIGGGTTTYSNGDTSGYVDCVLISTAWGR